MYTMRRRIIWRFGRRMSLLQKPPAQALPMSTTTKTNATSDESYLRGTANRRYTLYPHD